MNARDLGTKWSSFGPQLRSTLRIVAAAMFMLAGTMKIFAFPAGIFTRPAAFLMSGQMAVAYFRFHFPQSFWPTQNGGVAAVGAGPWSLDATLRK
jgi:putative oxidoreductase